ncbi:putative LRR receptor-like serine/threonine-protein kinase [Gossypium australe]|uniref:Putative LRR receptor-like serine/threonine-protein kinase n=1 Tax=Gossypium australe TaxID=47621 RepID=A0A5B6WUX1_9ROSI|nr:putative LRR receptor-like serine/threonine-protein kinase [Gossypium australe]
MLIGELIWTIGDLQLGFVSRATRNNMSTTKAEYKGLAHTTTEIVWLESFLSELHVSLLRKAIVVAKNLVVRHVSAQEQVADVFTKPLSAHLLLSFDHALRLV